ncbi:MAG: nucleotide sugar dehydrogenase, partial [Actinomycetota bacterium]|nr:nucleotide sugar dehydrogenase [Actinomycetota bacterium]
VSSPAVAELSKLIENTFRHVNIALVNELAMFAAALGVDVWEAIDAASTKPFGFMAFRPGPGVGGHCLPIDPTYLSWRVKRQLDETFRFVELANDVNRHMPSHIVTRIQGVLNEAKLAVNGSRIVVLGYSYKPNTADARESPARVIVKQLSELGADVAIVDPHVRAPTLSNGAHVMADAPDELVAAADIVVLVTDHDAFDYERIERRAGRIFDTRRRFGGLGRGNVTYL